MQGKFIFWIVVVGSGIFLITNPAAKNFITPNAPKTSVKNKKNDALSSGINTGLITVCDGVDSIYIKPDQASDLSEASSEVYFLHSGKIAYLFGPAPFDFYKDQYYSFDLVLIEKNIYKASAIEELENCKGDKEPEEEIQVIPKAQGKSFWFPPWRPPTSYYVAGSFLSIF